MKFVFSTRVLFALWTVALSSCVTTSKPSTADLSAWQNEQDAIRKKIATEQAPLRKTLAQKKLTKPFLWKIEKAGKTSYLLGSMHVSISASELPVRVHQLFNKSMVHAFESDGQLSAKSKTLLAQDSQESPDGPCLDKTLPPDAWAILHHDLLPFEEFNYRCLPPSNLYNFYINMRTFVLQGEQSSLDAELMAESRAPGFQTAYLETSAEAMSALAAILKVSDKEKLTLQELSAYLKGDRLADIKQEIAKTYELGVVYKSGDLAQIQQLTAPEMVLLYPELIERRNHLWLPRLVKILDQGNAFITVGAAHMTGPASLLVLLEKQGYTIHRLTLNELKP